MRTSLHTLSRRLAQILRSEWFFRALIAVFIGEAAWIALTGNYPMAFDENFHFGLIQLYSHHLNPFLGGQPAGGDAFGAVARDPSYLYHYLMSFPYRLIALFTHDQTIQVLILRFINIALFATCLPLFRRTLRRTKVSPFLINVSFAIFVLLPVVPFLAAQINYDNLLLPLVAAVVELTLAVSEELRRSTQLNFMKFGALLTLCLLASLVKYAFLPIFLAIIIFFAWQFVSYQRASHQLVRAISDGWRKSRVWHLVLVAFLLLVSLTAFSQRYVLNLIDYHQIVPNCGQVLSVKQCSAYGPWNRDYTLALSKPANDKGNPLDFTGDWFYGMWLRLFFAVDGPDSDFQTRGPLFLPAVAAIAATVAGILFLIRYGGRLWRRLDPPFLVLTLLAIGLYIGSLWVDEYRSFLATGQPVAINGRYLLPIMIPAIILLALAYREFFRQRPTYQALTVYLILFCFICGGGALTYILRSNDEWYWPSPVVKTANHVVKKVAGPVTPGNSHPTAFLK
jgi:hypothetical protein